MNKALWRALGRNTIISIILFGALLGLLYLAEMLFPSLQGQLIQFDSAPWVVGIPASIIGVAYILTVRDPQNYTGKSKLVDTAGRVDKFMSRYGNRTRK